MIPQGILAQLMAQQGQGQAATGAPQNPGMLLGGQPMQMPQMPQQPNPNGGSAMSAPQATSPGAMGAAPAQGQQQGILPNMTGAQANAISTGLNTAAANMPHAANQAVPTAGLTSQGVMNALGSGMAGGQTAMGGGMGAGMLSPQLIQLLRQGGGNGTA